MREPLLAGVRPHKTAVAIMIDDDEACRAMYSHMLEAHGYHVIGRERAEGVVELAVSEHPSAIIVDISLPGMNGIAACELLKNDARTCHIPVVVLTGHDSFESVRQCTAAGADGYLVKPAKPSRVMEMLGRLTAT